MAINLQSFQPRIDYLDASFLKEAAIQLGMLRLDQLHPVVSGNKWYKLKENLKAAVDHGKTSILTFGGAYSNHLIATAYASRQAGLGSIGIVRGMRPPDQYTTTLNACMAAGMLLRPVTRAVYAEKDGQEWLDELRREFPNAWIVPEGGQNRQGRAGVAEIAAFIPEQTSVVCVPVGSGTTFTGLRNHLSPTQQMIGFVPIKNGRYLESSIAGYLHAPETPNWTLEDRFHFGGFARYKPELIRFMNHFFAQFHVPLDFVYTGKMMYGLQELIKTEKQLHGKQIIAIHTGGLQGNQSISNQLIF